MKIKEFLKLDETISDLKTSVTTLFKRKGETIGEDFQSILNSNAMNNFSLASNNENLVSTDLNFDMDCMNISEEDALFFDELVNNPQISLNINTGELINMSDLSTNTDMQVYKPMEVSKGLLSLISKAQETQKPVRLDFDNDITVIMKVDKEGKLSAEFIPGDKAVEQYLRANIPFLKQRFDEQNISYNDLYYRQGSSKKYKNNYDNNKGESNEWRIY